MVRVRESKRKSAPAREPRRPRFFSVINISDATHHEVVRIGHVIGRLDEVEADAVGVVRVDERGGTGGEEELEALDFHEQIHRLGFGVVPEVEGHDGADQSQQVGKGLVGVRIGAGQDARAVLLADLARQRPHELVPPRPEIVANAVAVRVISGIAAGVWNTLGRGRLLPPALRKELVVPGARELELQTLALCVLEGWIAASGQQKQGTGEGDLRSFSKTGIIHTLCHRYIF